MKKLVVRMTAIVLTMLCLLVMAACGDSDSPDATEPTGNTQIPTEVSGETVGETEPAQVTDPAATEATDPVGTVWDAAYFETLLNPQMYRGEHDWYNLALTSYYAAPEEIDLYRLFYNGFTEQDEDPTPEELEFLEEQPGFESDYSLKRLPTAQMDAVMAKYFGTTLAACNQTGMDMLVYWDQTDCYYCWHTDSGLVENIRVTDCMEQADGTYRIAYTEGYLETPAVVVLKPLDDGWQFVSNLQMDEIR